MDLEGAPIGVLVVAEDEDMRLYVERCLGLHPLAVRATMATQVPPARERPPGDATAVIIADLDSAGPDRPRSLRALVRVATDRAAALLLLTDDPAAATADVPEPPAGWAVLAKPFNALGLCVTMERLLGRRMAALGAARRLGLQSRTRSPPTGSIGVEPE